VGCIIDRGGTVTITVDHQERQQLGDALRLRHTEAAERYLLQLQEVQRLRQTEPDLGDVVDAGARVADAEQQEILAAALLEQVQRLELALARFDDGSLGACQRCGKDIPAARLEIMPWATHCVPCQQAADRLR
jgi:DnaK suppressor protein